MFSGTLEGVMTVPPLTGKYLISEQSADSEARRAPGPKMLKLTNAAKHNLKNIDVEIPLGMMTCITGVSIGQITLVHECLFEAVNPRHSS